MSRPNPRDPGRPMPVRVRVDFTIEIQPEDADRLVGLMALGNRSEIPEFVHMSAENALYELLTRTHGVRYRIKGRGY